MCTSWGIKLLVKSIAFANGISLLTVMSFPSGEKEQSSTEDMCIDDNFFFLEMIAFFVPIFHLGMEMHDIFRCYSNWCITKISYSLVGRHLTSRINKRNGLELDTTMNSCPTTLRMIFRLLKDQHVKMRAWVGEQSLTADWYIWISKPSFTRSHAKVYIYQIWNQSNQSHLYN